MTLSCARELEAEMLVGGVSLRVRPVRRLDGWRIRDLYRRLSPRSQYLRFFTVMPALPDSLVSLLTAVDDGRRLALIVEARTAFGREPVALANYAATDGGAVEVALVVRDEWQHRGIGTEIARRLVGAARARGFERFVAYVLLENRVARRLIDRVGVVVSSKIDGGVSEVLFVDRAA